MIRTASLTLALTLAACATDEKGESCGFLDAYANSDGETYCPDVEAPDDCQVMNDALIDAAVVCADGLVTEEQLRDELASRDALFDCDEAVATSTTYDDCVDILTDAEDPPCEGTSLAPLPEVCQGSVLLAS